MGRSRPCIGPTIDLAFHSPEVQIRVDDGVQRCGRAGTGPVSGAREQGDN